MTKKASAAAMPSVIGCPIRASLGVLGHKWALMVLRDIAFYDGPRFSDMRRSIDGLTSRVLTFRLRELQREDFIRKTTRAGEDIYELTAKGADAIPILAALTSFGVRHHADEVFQDGRPRDLGQIAPNQPQEILGAVAHYAARGRHIRLPPPRPLPKRVPVGRPSRRASLRV